MTKRFLAIWILAVMLTLLCAPAVAIEGSEFLPPIGALLITLGDMTFWDYWLDDLGTSLFLFMNTSAEMRSDTGDEKHMDIRCSDYPDIDFALDFYRMDDVKGQTMSDLSEQKIWSIIPIACGYATELVSEPQIIEPGEDCVFMRFFTVFDDVYASHLLTIYDGWLVHMSAMATEKGEEGIEIITTGDVMTFQNTILYLLEMDISVSRYTRYALPGSGLEIATADGKQHLVLEEDTEEYKELMLLTPDGRGSALRITWIKDDALIGKTSETLTDEQWQEMYHHIQVNARDTDAFSASAMEADMTRIPSADGFFILYEPKTSSYSATLAFKDGWTMSIFLFNNANAEPTLGKWRQDALESINRRFMGEDTNIPAWEAPAATKQDFAEMHLSGSDFTFVYPENAETTLLASEDEGQVVLLQDPAFGRVVYAFFTILSPDLRDFDLMNLSAAEKQALIDRISSQRGDIEVLEANRLTDDGPLMLRIREDTHQGGYSEHLLGFYGDWLVNMMVQRLDSETEMNEAEVTYQEILLDENLRRNQDQKI